MCFIAHTVHACLAVVFVDSKQLGKQVTLDKANSMGLFLQKTNIIRDYLEDMDDGRTWWPQDIW